MHIVQRLFQSAGFTFGIGQAVAKEITKGVNTVHNDTIAFMTKTGKALATLAVGANLAAIAVADTTAFPTISTIANNFLNSEALTVGKFIATAESAASNDDNTTDDPTPTAPIAPATPDVPPRFPQPI